MPKPIVSVFEWMGWTRDDVKWFWMQIVAAAGLVTTGVLDLTNLGNYIGVSISDTTAHRIVAASAVILWVGGKMSPSGLKKGDK